MVINCLIQQYLALCFGYNPQKLRSLHISFCTSVSLLYIVSSDKLALNDRNHFASKCLKRNSTLNLAKKKINKNNPLKEILSLTLILKEMN